MDPNLWLPAVLCEHLQEAAERLTSPRKLIQNELWNSRTATAWIAATPYHNESPKKEQVRLKQKGSLSHSKDVQLHILNIHGIFRWVPSGPKDWRKNNIALRDWNFQAGQKAFQPEFGAYQGLERVLKSPSNPQNCENKKKILQKGTIIFCAKIWYAPNPYFCNGGGEGNSEGQDWNFQSNIFQARLTISSEISFFDLWALGVDKHGDGMLEFPGKSQGDLWRCADFYGADILGSETSLMSVTACCLWEVPGRSKLPVSFDVALPSYLVRLVGATWLLHPLSKSLVSYIINSSLRKIYVVVEASLYCWRRNYYKMNSPDNFLV